jgi:hypothetical protein
MGIVQEDANSLSWFEDDKLVYTAPTAGGTAPTSCRSIWLCCRALYGNNSCYCLRSYRLALLSMGGNMEIHRRLGEYGANGNHICPNSYTLAAIYLRPPMAAEL